MITERATSTISPTPPLAAEKLSTPTSTILAPLQKRAIPTATSGCDSERIAFVSQREGNPEIYLMDGETGYNVVNITNDPAEDWLPSWRPDGEAIAFASYRTGKGDIYAFTPNGDNLYPIADDPDLVEIWPDWSPDGTKLVYMCGSNRELKNSSEESVRPEIQYDICVIQADGANSRTITKGIGDNWAPSWSQNGQFIAFHSFRDESGSSDIWIFDLDESELHNVTENDGTVDAYPDWAPDSKSLVFASHKIEDPSVIELYTMQPDGGDREPLTKLKTISTTPDWSPDGNYIAFQTKHMSNPSYPDDLEILRISTTGDFLKNLTDHSARDSGASWSPRCVGSLQSGTISELQTTDKIKNVIFASETDPSMLNTGLQWNQGDRNNDYKIEEASNTLILLPFPGANQWEGIDTAPIVSYSVGGDFLASVKIEFSPLQSVQAAGLGVRSSVEPENFMRIVNQNLSDTRAIVVNGQIDGEERHQGEALLDTDTVYFRISRSGNLYTFEYSTDNLKWETLKHRYGIDLIDPEIYLVALSTHPDEGAEAKFSNLSYSSKEPIDSLTPTPGHSSIATSSPTPSSIENSTSQDANLLDSIGKLVPDITVEVLAGLIILIIAWLASRIWNRRRKEKEELRLSRYSEQRTALVEVLGKMIPDARAALNAPPRTSLQREKISELHKRFEAVRPLFYDEPGVTTALTKIGNLVGNTVSVNYVPRDESFDAFETNVSVLEGALKRLDAEIIS